MGCAAHKLKVARPRKQPVLVLDPELEAERQEVRELLMKYQEFRAVPVDTIEGRLIARAIYDLENAGNALARNEARKFLDEKSRKWSVASTDRIRIVFSQRSSDQ